MYADTLKVMLSVQYLFRETNTKVELLLHQMKMGTIMGLSQIDVSKYTQITTY